MASVLSGWYGYNLFNVASFIEFAEPFPKRRKLDQTNSYRGVPDGPEPVGGHRDSAARVKSQAGVSYRPYVQERGPTPADRRREERRRARHGRHRDGEQAVVASGPHAASEEGVGEKEGALTLDCLFPELLCLIFEQLDLQSKGRAAQVTSLVNPSHFTALDYSAL
jgi:hypothetical protein